MTVDDKDRNDVFHFTGKNVVISAFVRNLERAAGFEPAVPVLQTGALSTWLCPLEPMESGKRKMENGERRFVNVTA